MQVAWFSRLRDRFGKWAVIVPGAVVLLIVIFILYLNLAFPRTRCAAVKHLDSPESVSDCYECHLKATPQSGPGLVREQAWPDTGQMLCLSRPAGWEGRSAFCPHSGGVHLPGMS